MLKISGNYCKLVQYQKGICLCLLCDNVISNSHLCHQYCTSIMFLLENNEMEGSDSDQDVIQIIIIAFSWIVSS